MESVSLEMVLAAVTASAGGAILIERRFLEDDYEGLALGMELGDEGLTIALLKEKELEYAETVSEEDSRNSSGEGILGTTGADGQIPGETDAGGDGSRGSN